MSTITVESVEAALLTSWSSESSTKWKQSNPALGQCGVTALVVQDNLGGEIYKTIVQKPGGHPLWHFYNRVNGKFIDFTSSQFDEPVSYENVESERAEAFADTNTEQYAYLSQAVKSCFADE